MQLLSIEIYGFRIAVPIGVGLLLLLVITLLLLEGHVWLDLRAAASSYTSQRCMMKILWRLFLSMEGVYVSP